MSRITIEHGVEHERGKHGIRLANDEIELVIATDFGPRVLVFAPRGGANVFGFLSPDEQAKATDFGEPWHIYGGHRLWHAPEDPVSSRGALCVCGKSPSDERRRRSGSWMHIMAGPPMRSSMRSS